MNKEKEYDYIAIYDVQLNADRMHGFEFIAKGTPVKIDRYIHYNSAKDMVLIQTPSLKCFEMSTEIFDRAFGYNYDEEE